MARQQFTLTIYTKSPRPLGPAQLKVIQDALNLRFKDAHFQISDEPTDAGWHPSQLTEGSRDLFEALTQKDEWHDLPGNRGRVAIHRLKKQLPPHLKIVTRRNHGYRMVDVRKTA